MSVEIGRWIQPDDPFDDREGDVRDGAKALPVRQQLLCEGDEPRPLADQEPDGPNQVVVSAVVRAS